MSRRWLPCTGRLPWFPVLALTACLAWLPGAGSPADEAEEGLKPLFDGRTLTGWDGDPEVWRVEDGMIVGESTPEKPLKRNTFLIWRLGEVDDFELRFEYRFASERGNSGVQYRSFEDPEKLGKWVVGGYQADFETGDRFSGIL